MATTDYFVSIPKRRLTTGELAKSEAHSGTSSTATDYIELRMQMDTAADAAHPTGLIRRDVLVALEFFEKWVTEGGLLGDGTNVPPTS